MLNKKTLVTCGIGAMLCLVALGGAALNFDHMQTRAADPSTPPSLSSPPSSSPGTAQGDVVQSTQPTVTYSVLGYWNKKRMKAAHPAEELLNQALLKTKTPAPIQTTTSGTPQLIDPMPPTSEAQSNTQSSESTESNGSNGSQAAHGQAQSSRATLVAHPDDYPYSTVGKVFFSYNKTDYVCSGTAITSSNQSTIDTAGHCVAAAGSKHHFYTNWVFCARYSDKDGCDSSYMWAAQRLFTHANWINNGWLTYDYGEAVVSPNSSTNSVNAADSVTEAIGSAGVAYDLPAQQQYSALGYPQQAPFNGTQLWECQSGLTGQDQPNKSGSPTSAITCDMTGGSSGGGWLISQKGKFGYVNGHNDYKYTNDPAHMYSPYYGDDWFKVYDEAQNYGA